MLTDSLESVSMQKVQIVATTTDILGEVETKSEKLNENEQKIVKTAGDTLQKALSYFNEAFASERIMREITEEMEKLEELEADPQLFIKENLVEMESQIAVVNNLLQPEKER